jgi:UDP-N-acetylmuramyl pentapeptide phosphotransferase/UDP-N-acetylglucosamine-1-phosphate transferase
MAGVLIGAFIVVGVSLWDDYRSLGPGYRIIVHALAALAAVGGGLELGSLAFLDLHLPLDGWWGKALLVIFITWTINLYNFMDGMDGLAGSMGVVGFSCLGIIGFCVGESVLPWLALSIAAASGGFLVLNYPPARIFMGDGGASTLGFLTGVFIVWGNGVNAVPFWIGLLVFSPFLIDATYTLMRRVSRGERVWEAHKTHLYQLLVDRVGWSHERTLAWETALMLACALSGFVGSCLTPELLEWWIGFWVCVYLGLVLGLRGYIRRRAALR